MTRSSSNTPANDKPQARNEPMAASSQQPAAGTSPQAPGAAPAQDGERLGMPHERDLATGDAGEAPHEAMKQAKKDLDAGQADTDLHGAAGMDEQRRMAGGKPGN